MADEKLGSRGQAWFCTTGLPSDVVIEVERMSYHLHKVSNHPNLLFILGKKGVIFAELLFAVSIDVEE